MKFWLIQRAEGWNENPVEDITGFAGGRDNLLHLDYMGSAEFEFGAIPKAFRRIMGEFDEYSISQSSITNSNGVPLQIYCKPYMLHEIEEALKEYIANPYYMQENPRFPYSDYSPNHPRAWWDIRNDFIMFFGVQDRVNKFNTIINREYNNWWMTKPLEIREADLKEAYHNRW